MAGKSTQLTLKVAAINQATKVFNDISASASATIGKIAKWAIGLGAAYYSAKGLSSSIQEMGKLSDVATAAGASVSELTKLSQALSSLGVMGAKPEELANSFLRLAKTTGKSGLAGFYEVMEAISKLPSEQERAQAATAAFGRAGLQYMRLFSAGADGGVESLKKLVEGMAGVSDAAAESGDNVMDSWGFLTNEAKRLWYEAIGKIVSYFDSKFEGGLREAALRGAAYMRYFAKVAWRWVKPFFDDFQGSFAKVGEWLSSWCETIVEMVSHTFSAMRDVMANKMDQFFFKFFAGVDAAWKMMTGDMEGAQRAIEIGEAEDKRVAKANEKVWADFRKKLESTKPKIGLGQLLGVKTDDLKEELEAELKKAHETAIAQKKLQDRMNRTENSENDGGRLTFAGAAPKNVNPEALLGGTYKAVTFALRAGYATAQEKIAKGVEKITELLKGVKDNTAEMADGMDVNVLN